jgi:hypothetical protein
MPILHAILEYNMLYYMQYYNTIQYYMRHIEGN